MILPGSWRRFKDLLFNSVLFHSVFIVLVGCAGDRVERTALFTRRETTPLRTKLPAGERVSELSPYAVAFKEYRPLLSIPGLFIFTELQGSVDCCLVFVRVLWNILPGRGAVFLPTVSEEGTRLDRTQGRRRGRMLETGLTGH